jgi:hypothetical protein
MVAAGLLPLLALVPNRRTPMKTPIPRPA